MDVTKLGALTLCFMVGVVACSKPRTQHNQLTTKEKNQGYKLLFNGENLGGWHSYRQARPGSAWSVENGAITLDPGRGPGGDLVTDKQYREFALKLEWKISPGGNSGVMFSIHESPQFQSTYVTGPEMQVLDNKSYKDDVKPSQLAGSLYDLIAAPPSTAKPAGPVYYVNEFPDSTRYPTYYNGKLFIYDFMRDWIMAVTMYQRGPKKEDLKRIEPFMPNADFNSMMDMEVGPDGRFYIIEYGNNAGWFKANTNSGLYVIKYNLSTSSGT